MEQYRVLTDKGRLVWGLLIFSVLAIVSLGLGIFDEVTQSKSSGRVAIILAIGRGVEPLWVTAGMLTYTSVEGVAMIAEIFLKAREERGKREGREETNAEWEAWFAKFQEAQKKGEKFDEPMPSQATRSEKS